MNNQKKVMHLGTFKYFLEQFTKKNSKIHLHVKKILGKRIAKDL